MPRKIDEASLTKGQLRKLNALRKSLGPDIADKAFGEWFRMHGDSDGAAGDKTAEILGDVIAQAVDHYGLHFPRGGYVVRRGRGRVIVEQAAAE